MGIEEGDVRLSLSKPSNAPFDKLRVTMNKINRTAQDDFICRVVYFRVLV